jgi:hypothetical protein
MPISQEQIKLLESYRDKTYITSILCSQSSEHFSIILNAWTSLILSLVGNFKLPEQATYFSQIQVKMNSLCHKIEDKLTIDLESCKIEDIRHFINDYDTLYEQLDYSFPNFIKNRVKKVYSGKKVLPNILNCEIRFVKIDEV